MPKLIKPLTDPQCQSAKAKAKAYDLLDGCNLNLRIYPSGTKSWRWKYKRNKGEKYESPITFGSYPALSLKEARLKRMEYEKMLINGLDPKEEIIKQQVKCINSHTLENITKLWLDSYASKKPLCEEYKAKRLKRFENHLFPKFKNKAIEHIKLAELKDVINEIYEKSADNAQRMRSDLILIYSYAKQYNYIEINIARELVDMDLSKPKSKIQHRSTLDKLDQIPLLIQKIKAYTGNPLTRLCLLLTLHVFIRSSEIRFARWSEINFDEKQWVIPEERQYVDGARYSNRGSKMKVAHVVPLSPQVIEILKELYAISGSTDYLFPSVWSNKIFLSPRTPNNALHRMGYKNIDLCLHGFRTLARSALGETRLFSEKALEKQMSHKESNQVKGSYTHIATYMEERRKIMNVWSQWLQVIEHGDYITPYNFANEFCQN
ncbi:MAG: integrase arm-type DNA-binding domain-containing protein [Campylobacterales bacterium]|nr:integrase arm-type DNA-binding domain-containing protein [Campylobacterales bacterium]